MNDDTWGPTRFQIGQPWPWEPEWVQTRGFRWLPDSMVLLMVEDNVDNTMREAIAGPVDLALVGTGPLVGIMARFGDLWGWSESLVWRRPGQGVPDNMVPDDSPHPHVLFHVVLVDTHTKIIEHMRVSTASAHFTTKMYEQAALRWTEGTDVAHANAAATMWEQQFPTVDEAVNGAVARCHAGD